MSALVSIIVPVFNAQAYIGQCVDSVKSQIYKNWELLLINDGSTDQTEEIIENLLNDERIKTFSQSNKGVVKARQVGVLHAKGEFIFFLDADDELPANALNDLINAHQKNHAEIIVGGHLAIQNDKKIEKWPVLNSHDTLDYVKSALKGEILSTVWGNLYRAHLLKQLYHFPNFKIGEDLLMNLEIIMDKYPRIEVIPTVVYHYYSRENSVMQQQTELSAKYRMDFLEALDDFLLHKELREKCKKEYAYRAMQIWTWLIFNNQKQYILDKDYKKEFKRYYKESSGMMPKYAKRVAKLHQYSPQAAQKIIEWKTKKN